MNSKNKIWGMGYGVREKGINRRSFVKSSVAAASILPAFNVLAGSMQTIGPADDQVNIAIVGYGCAGEELAYNAMKIPGVRITAVCDIWDYRRRIARGRLRSLGHDVNVYDDYREMLSAEDKNIDCCIVATPNWMHREVSCACLEAGKHAYCEAPMSNRLNDAREMVLCQRRTGILLQIGLQRRSNPRYMHAINTVINKHSVVGEVTHGYAQWNCVAQPFLSVRERLRLPTEVLEKYGYETMEHFLNWRWFPLYGGGVYMDYASHQLDPFIWAWGCVPVSVMATGGNELFGRQVKDNVMAIYDFQTKNGKIKRLFHQVLSNTSRGGFFEQFMGMDGIVKISENKKFGDYAWPQIRECGHSREDWMKFHESGVFFGRPVLDVGFTKYGCEKITIIKESRLSDNTIKPPRMPHLENFFSAVRHDTPLSCPAEVGYRATVAALATDRAIKERRTIDLKSEDFEVKPMMQAQ